MACNLDGLFIRAPFKEITFGFGSSTFSKQKPIDFGFTTAYTQVFEGLPHDGHFAIVNRIPTNLIDWHDGESDNSSDAPFDGTDYMLLVNIGDTKDEFFRTTISNLTIGNHYYFSVFLGNVGKKGRAPVEPNIVLQVRKADGSNGLLAETRTGSIRARDRFTWEKGEVQFVARSSAVTLIMISEAPKGWGNDLAIDNIELGSCT